MGARPLHTLLCLGLFSLAGLSGCGLFGGADELILTRRGDDESRAIAECYADRQGLAEDRIVELSLGVSSADSTIDAETFEKEVAKAIERVVLENVAVHPVLGAAPTGPNDEYELTVGDGAKEPFDQRGAEETGRAGDGDALPGEVLPNHVSCSSKALYQLVENL